MATDVEFLAFCELVRQQSSSIASLAMAGKAEEAGQAALSLCSQAAQRKRQILEQAEPADDDARNYDLRNLRLEEE